MLVINAEFERFSDASFYRLYDAIGVYVIWGPGSKRRPKYIGEGEILKRLLSHMKWLHRPFDGFVYIAGYRRYADAGKAKSEAEAVEWALLDAADELNRFPTQNQILGKSSGLRYLTNTSDNTFRLRLSGYDPLRAPERRRLASPKVITYRRDDDYDWYRDGRPPWRSI